MIRKDLFREGIIYHKRKTLRVQKGAIFSFIYNMKEKWIIYWDSNGGLIRFEISFIFLHRNFLLHHWSRSQIIERDQFQACRFTIWKTSILNQRFSGEIVRRWTNLRIFWTLVTKSWFWNVAKTVIDVDFFASTKKAWYHTRPRIKLNTFLCFI